MTDRLLKTLLAAAVLTATIPVPAYAGKKAATEIISNLSKTRAEISANVARNIRG